MALTKDDVTIIRDIVAQGVEATVEILNPRLEALEEGQVRMEKRLENLETEVKGVKIHLISLERRISKLEQRFGTLEGKLEALSADVHELYDMIERHPEITNKQEFRDYAEHIVAIAHTKLKSLAKEADVTFPSR
jgi:predicted nuclease with TOPRIM domain